MEAHPDVGIMGCRVLNTDGTVQPTCSRFPTLLNLILLTSGLWKFGWPPFLDRYQMRRWDRRDERDVDVISGCFMMARMSAVRQVGLFDEEFFFFGEEADWCRRFQQAGWALRFAPVGEITHHGGRSVRKLNHKRDLLLSSATVRLHRKHGGLLAALIAWLILATFNISRAIFWTVRAAVSGRAAARQRRDHFRQVVRHQRDAWPRKRASRT